LFSCGSLLDLYVSDAVTTIYEFWVNHTINTEGQTVLIMREFI